MKVISDKKWNKVESKCEAFANEHFEIYKKLDITVGELVERIFVSKIKPKAYLTALININIDVDWHQERASENDDNGGKRYGIYVFDCTKADYELEENCDSGYGSFDVIEVFWFKSELKRNIVLNDIK